MPTGLPVRVCMCIEVWAARGDQMWEPDSGKWLGQGEKGSVAEPGLPLPSQGHFPAGQQCQLGLGGHMFHPSPKGLLHKVRLPYYPKNKNRSQVMTCNPCPELLGLF